MAGDVINIKVCSPLKLRNGLTGNYHAICHYSYNLPLSATPTEGLYNKQLTDKSSTTDRTLQHICKPHKANAQTQACKRAAILPTHPSPPTTRNILLKKLA